MGATTSKTTYVTLVLVAVAALRNINKEIKKEGTHWNKKRTIGIYSNIMVILIIQYY